MSLRRLLSTLALAAFTATGCGAPDNGVTFTGGERTAIDANVAARGEALFSRFCSTCHGPDATGGAAFRGSIQGAQSIANIVRNGADGMPGNPLDDAEIGAIEAFLAVQAGATVGDAPDPAPVGGGGTPASGSGNGSGGGGGSGTGTGGGDGGAQPAPSPAPAPAPSPTPAPDPGDDDDEDDDADEGDD